MVKNGNAVTFDEGGCSFRSKATGKEIKITERNGSYEVDLWVKGSDQKNVA